MPQGSFTELMEFRCRGGSRHICHLGAARWPRRVSSVACLLSRDLALGSVTQHRVQELTARGPPPSKLGNQIPPKYSSSFELLNTLTSPGHLSDTSAYLCNI